LVEKVRRAYQAPRIHNGVFGAKMDVTLVNDGPVTFTIDTQVK
jgi:D-tyrosyl-tRNA(Tyr) deacylase